MKGAEALLKTLAVSGVDTCFMNPGTSEMHFVASLDLVPAVRPVLALFEGVVTGAADGLWKNLVKNGRANYICGYHPLFMLGKCAKRLLQPPFLVGSAGLFYGFITGYFKRIQQVDDRAAIAYLRRQQLNRLRGAESIWK